MTAVTYEQVAELPGVIEEYPLDVLSRRVSSGCRRFTTVFGLAGGGHRGVGEDVTYEAIEHRLLQRSGAALPLAGTWTLEAFSQHLDQLDTFPDRPPADEVPRAYRRWALESAALDLPLRQAGRPLHQLLGRLPAPVRFVVSLNLGQAPTCAPLLSRRAACGALRFKLDATSESGDELLECLAASGCVDAIDFKGVYQGTLSAARTDASLYQHVAEALPDAWLEDPDLSDPAARAARRSQRPRVTWDAPIHSAADIAAQRWPPRTLNLEPSRFGTLRALFNTYDYRAAHGIRGYGGGQYELGPGRGQAQYLAALFHPDAPNDLAPAGFDQPAPPRDAPCYPMTVTPDPTGFGAQPEPRTRARVEPGSANSCNPACGALAAVGDRPAPGRLPTQTKGCVMKIEVFDPAMCCSTGVCGPSVPPALARFAGDLEWLARQGVKVTRYNLTHEPQAFLASEPARTALAERGEQSLPLIFADGEQVSTGRYPVRSELAGWAGVTLPRRGESLTMAAPASGSGGCCGGGGGC